LTLEAGKQFETLLRYLRDNRGFDYTGYKRNTIVRRIGKRCTELGLTSFGAYQDYLQVHGDEFAILFDKILINVTDFFRDPLAWDYLAKDILPRIIEKPGLIRIWSPGTASGEEAYSAAILFCEALGPEAFLRRVKIYATDLDEPALEKARAGYTEQELESVDQVLRARYFEPLGGRYAFKASLRRSLIFGRHDLMQDAPISRLNLLIRRNIAHVLHLGNSGSDSCALPLRPRGRRLSVSRSRRDAAHARLDLRTGRLEATGVQKGPSVAPQRAADDPVSRRKL
jgi:two-component system CheB/CheR fusion protein